MDNLTHSLIGLLVGEAAATVAPSQAKGICAKDKRTALLGLMLIGSNLPDLDFVYSRVTGNPLDYLLHHRGHTHTVIGALIATALMLLVCELWLRRRGQQPSRQDRLHLTIVALLAPLIHLALDFTNSYGIHPFWPFWNGWLYGDAVFIVEPLLWSVAAPLVFTLRSRVARGIVALVIGGGVALACFTGMVPWLPAIGLISITLLLLAIGRFAPQRVALFAGIAAWLLISAAFFAASHRAAAQLDQIAAAQFPDDTIVDRILTPMPVDPLCWDVMLVQSNHGELILRRATLALAPSLLAVEQCAKGRLRPTAITAPRHAVQQVNTSTMRWSDEVVTPTRTLQQLQGTRCEAAALLQFARAPWATHLQSQNRWLVGDLRYDMEAGAGFAEVSIAPQGERCVRHVPPWIPPRADVLSPR